jgi:hypothetical protein
MSDTDRSRLPRPERGSPLRLHGGVVESLPAASGDHDRVGESPSDPDGGLPKWLLNGLRYVLPVLVVLAGAVIMALGSENDLEGGASIVSAGLAIYFLNWLYRIGVSGDRERDTEEAARDYFAQHGRWPS